ncbi:FHA domain-containing protein [Acidianus sulfidivorans JP7]|uniref:FHA domain-containing protein n=1 Tax=Acidianus sulfidivorans JP7 TaxID=619593 RepID=A0A2U9IN23_9CREN|nr:FHA domain-containing protein [Acidianus sulfidivorans]AWR97405.1 FHA domain-containing protein [Acidianus sulfidivorans JP7]
MTWKCPYCGYENSDDSNFCINCGAKKPENINSAPVQQPVVSEAANPQNAQPSLESEQSTQGQTSPPESISTPAQATLQSSEATSVSSQPSEQLQETVKSENQTQQTESNTQQVVSQPTTNNKKYYILFIATPASALNKSKVPLDFDIFENISIGRSPENVIVIPDPEVSRRHAIISLEGDKLYIEDLNSTNGTYIYDGKIFNPIKGKIEIQPNSLIKLGNNTIIRIVTE